MSSSVLPYSIELRNYLWEKGLDENPVLKRLREETENHPFALMQICPEQGALMANLVRLISAKKAIEVGTFTGYSALAVALALPEDGYLLACDISEEFTSIGKPYWEEAGVSENIDLQIAPAVETLKSKIEDGESNTYDFAFIDADKINYLNYYELCLDLIRPGGVIAIDNVLWGGSVIDSARTDDDTKAIREINDFIVSDKRVNISMIPVGDGVTLAVQK
ncbi:MAG: class I SAM-dependent methyltransferase [Pseudomonadota bacterium]|nr:class I SAM-dependent methyltransferase [Pseudomonadota bacterium]